MKMHRKRMNIAARLAFHAGRTQLFQGGQLNSFGQGEDLGPKGTAGCAPGLYELSQVDRVVACGFSRTVQGEIAKIEATRYQEAPLQAYRLGQGAIIGGQILSGRERYYIGRSSPFEALKRSVKFLPEAHVYNSVQGLKYFGHWLHDDCSVREALGDRPGCVSLRRPAWPDAAVYEKAFGHEQDTVEMAEVGSLTVYSELGFNRAKAARLQRLRARLHRNLAAKGQGQVVFVKRGASAKARHIVNQDALIDRLRQAGVRIVEPEQGSEGMIEDLLGATTVISVEGSQAVHGIFCAKAGGALLTLQPPDRFYNPGVQWCRMVNLNYGIVIGTPAPGGFEIHPDEVLSMVDRLMAARPVSDN